MTKAAGSDFALEKALPGNIEAERLILGAILLDNTTINQAAERLKRDDFFLDSHRRIYDRMLELSENGRAIDPITLAEELQRTGDLTQIGGPAYIAALFDGVPRFSNIESYVGIVKGKSMLRRLITTSNQIMASCFDAEDDPEEILDQAEKMILAIAEDRIRQGFTHISEIAQKQFEHIEDIAGRQQLITGIATGFRDLDYMTSGLQRGDLIIVAARPSMGKCLAADAEIVLADGSVATIEEIYRRRAARLLTLNSNWKFSLTEPGAFVDDGLKPVFRVTTRLGRQVESTLTHPYLTLDGWRSLAELKKGDRIAVPREINVFGTEQLSDEQVTEIADIVACGKDPQSIPPIVFRLNRQKLTLFLERVIAGNGMAVSEKDVSRNVRQAVSLSLLLPGSVSGKHDKLAACRTSAESASVSLRREMIHHYLFQPGYITVSERLARQLQHLLLRFGIVTRLSKSPTREQQTSGLLWRLNSLRPDAAPGVTDSDVYWDEIISIEPLGLKQVYDLTIPETHNFVANDICVHNTAFSLNMAQNAALQTQEHGHRATVGVFSLEMSKEQLVQRLMCSQARLDAHRLRSGMLSKDDWRRLAQAVGELAEADIYIDDTPAITTLELRAKARRLRQEKRGLDLLIVDYLQLMSGRGRVESRQQEVSQISRELKGIAKELNVPLVALSQLSRATETRTDHRPQLSDLRESGGIEQDADLVMFIYRDEVYHPETEKQNTAEIIIGKQRNGPIGTVELIFLKQLTRFENKAYEG